nr:hypothetical protein BaRGS_002070 [Batillaria attramentaria]
MLPESGGSTLSYPQRVCYGPNWEGTAKERRFADSVHGFDFEDAALVMAFHVDDHMASTGVVVVVVAALQLAPIAGTLDLQVNRVIINSWRPADITRIPLLESVAAGDPGGRNNTENTMAHTYSQRRTRKRLKHVDFDIDSDSETEAPGPVPQSQPQSQSQSHSIEIWPRFLIVHCTAEGKKAARLHPFLVGETLRSCTGRPDASRLRSGDLLVECKRKAHSNSLLQLQKIGDYPVTVSPHRSLNSSRGVIRDEALADLGEAELIRTLKPQAVTHAKVFKTGTIILTFGQPTAPEKLWAGFYWVKVKAFIPLPLRCFKCQRFGHGQASCRNDPTCAKCGGKDHDGKDCSSSPHCMNCKGSHPSSSKDCPKWKEECTIQRIRVEQKVSFPEARRIASARIQKGDKGVEVTNPFSVLEDMEVVTIEDRPLPPSPLVSPSKTPAVT